MLRSFAAQMDARRFLLAGLYQLLQAIFVNGWLRFQKLCDEPEVRLEEVSLTSPRTPFLDMSEWTTIRSG